MNRKNSATLGLLGSLGIAAGLMGAVPASADQPEPPTREAHSTERAENSSAPMKAYVIGKLDGALADHLMRVLEPTRWKGQTDGLVILAGKNVGELNRKRRKLLRAVHAAGRPIVLTHAYQKHVDRLNKILGLPATVKLRLMTTTIFMPTPTLRLRADSP